MKKLTIIAVRYYLPSETFFSKIEFLEKEFETFFDQVTTVFIDLNTAKDKDTPLADVVDMHPISAPPCVIKSSDSFTLFIPR